MIFSFSFLLGALVRRSKVNHRRIFQREDFLNLLIKE